MKLMRYNLQREPISLARLGVLLPGGRVGDMRGSYARFLTEKMGDSQGREIAALRMPPHIVQFLAIGEPGWQAARAAVDYLLTLAAAAPGTTGLDGEPLIVSLADCRLHATVKPSKVIAIGRNYADHLKEAGLKIDMTVPSA